MDLAPMETRCQCLFLRYTQHTLDVRAHIGDLEVGHPDPLHEDRARRQQALEEGADLVQLRECLFQVTGPLGNQPQGVRPAPEQRLDDRGGQHGRHQPSAQEEPGDVPGKGPHQRAAGAHRQRPTVRPHSERHPLQLARQRNTGCGRERQPVRIHPW